MLCMRLKFFQKIYIVNILNIIVKKKDLFWKIKNLQYTY